MDSAPRVPQNGSINYSRRPDLHRPGRAGTLRLNTQTTPRREISCVCACSMFDEELPRSGSGRTGEFSGSRPAVGRMRAAWLLRHASAGHRQKAREAAGSRQPMPPEVNRCKPLARVRQADYGSVFASTFVSVGRGFSSSFLGSSCMADLNSFMPWPSPLASSGISCLRTTPIPR